ncbi:MAG: hypothetical protein J2P55_09595, partial [Rhizobiales bacterium]|nr:hypothetical protein [Hyphomicrobiales bacterium]
VPPAAIIEASGLPLSEKKKLQAMASQQDPMKVQAQQLLMADKQADIGKKQAEIGKIQTASLLNAAKARTQGMPGAPPPPKTPLDLAQQMADINETNATALHKRASATALYHKALVTPLQLLGDHAQRHADRVVDSFHRTQDRALDHFHRTQDRQLRSRPNDGQV